MSGATVVSDYCYICGALVSRGVMYKGKRFCDRWCMGEFKEIDKEMEGGKSEDKDTTDKS